MKLKKFFALALAAATLALALTACGSKAGDSADNSDANTDNQTGETVTVKLGVVGGIYDDLWASAKAALADEGIDLEIVQFSDYVTPNNALANGDIDLNAFQHRIYLQNEIDNYGYEIQNIGNTFIIPLNLYSQKVSSVDELKDGDVVAIPDDLTNGGRALKVLEAAGLIELDPNAAFNPTVDDITSYKVNITIEELKANTIPSVLPDVAAAVVNGNYALDFGLKTDEAIYKDNILNSCFSFQGKFFHFLTINRHRKIEYDLLYPTTVFSLFREHLNSLDKGLHKLLLLRFRCGMVDFIKCQ